MKILPIKKSNIVNLLLDPANSKEVNAYLELEHGPKEHLCVLGVDNKKVNGRRLLIEAKDYYKVGIRGLLSNQRETFSLMVIKSLRREGWDFNKFENPLLFVVEYTGTIISKDKIGVEIKWAK